MIEVTELSTLRALVSAGMDVVLVPAPQPGHVSTTRNTPLSDEGAFRSYGAVARQYGTSGRAARRFLDFVASRAVPPPPADSARFADRLALQGGRRSACSAVAGAHAH